jgi:hypothetical protein
MVRGKGFWSNASLSLLLALAAWGCGEGEADNGDHAGGCIPNAARACTCEDGSPGARTCLDGIRFSECRCADTGQMEGFGTAGIGEPPDPGTGDDADGPIPDPGDSTTDDIVPGDIEPEAVPEANDTPELPAADYGECYLRFGRASGRGADTTGMDYFSSWAGSGEEFNMAGFFQTCAAAGVTPVVYSYIIAFTARRDENLQDCNVSFSNNLCNYGATYIRANRERIIGQYAKYAQGAALSYGTDQPVIWMMEPDYYQYSTGGDPQSLTFAEAGELMKELVNTVRAHLPNAVFSLDISPWIADPAGWYGAFDMNDFTYINTSGGQTEANNDRIRLPNAMTWRGIHLLTGKGIIADDGYGVAGMSTGHDDTWDDVNNLNARIADGVVAILQASPKPDWSATIDAIRPQLSQTIDCEP